MANTNVRNPRHCAYSMILRGLKQTAPHISQANINNILTEVRNEREGSLKGLSVDDIVQHVTQVVNERAQQQFTGDAPPGLERVRAVSMEKCSICLEDLSGETERMSCNHEFHTDCMSKWIKENSLCPLCKSHALMSDDFPAL